MWRSGKRRNASRVAASASDESAAGLDLDTSAADDDAASDVEVIAEKQGYVFR